MNNLAEMIDDLNIILNKIEERCNREECIDIAMLIDRENVAYELIEAFQRIRIITPEICKKVYNIHHINLRSCLKLKDKVKEGVMARCSNDAVCWSIAETINLCVNNYRYYARTDFCKKYQTIVNENKNNLDYLNINEKEDLHHE